MVGIDRGARGVLVVVAFFITTLFTSAAGAQSLKLVTGNDFKPYTDEGLPGGGLVTEIIRRVFEGRGYTIDMTYFDEWNKVYDLAAAGEFAGTFPYYYRVRRARDFLYSDPIFAETQFGFYLSGRMDPRSPADMIGKTMCYPQGYAIPPVMVDYVASGQVQHEVPNTMARCFELLALERVDFVVAGKLQGRQLASATPDLEGSRLKITDFVFTENRMHFIISHDFPEAARILEDFNVGLRLMKATGRFKELVNEYLPQWDESPPLAIDFRAGIVSRYKVSLASGREMEADVAETAPGRFRLKTPYGDIELGYKDIGKFEEIAAADAAAATTASGEAPDLQLAGTAALGRALVDGLAQGFAATNGGTPGAWTEDGSNARRLQIGGATGDLKSFAVKLTTSDAALASLIDGESHVALSDRAVNASEAQGAEAAELGDLQTETAEKVIALEATAIVTNRASGIDLLSDEQVVGLLTGRITNWSAVGGKAIPVQVFIPGATTSTGELLSREILGGASVTRSAEVFEDVREVSAAVARSPGGIGVVPISASGDTQPVRITRCGILLAPTQFQVKTEEYPYVQRVFLYAPPQTRNKHVGPFVSFAESDAGQEIVARQGFVDLRASAQSADDLALHRQRLALLSGGDAVGADRYLRDAAGSSRISVTFRFRTGSSVLDARALRDVRRVATLLRERGAQTAVDLFGFADARGPEEQNQLLSQARASAVAAALKKELPDVRMRKVAGFGEGMPVACNDSEEGWQKNRRVEVWLRN